MLGVTVLVTIRLREQKKDLGISSSSIDTWESAPPPPRRRRRRRRDPRLSPGEEPPAAGSHSGVARREGPCGFRGEDEKGVTF